MAGQKFMSDADIDSLISDVEAKLNESIAKSEVISKSDEELPEMGGEESVGLGGDEAGSIEGDAPGMDETSDELGGEAAPAEAAPEEGMGEEMSNEGELLEEDHISDDELRHIYSSMDHEEVERHYMILRGVLSDAYSSMDGQGTEEAGQESMGQEGIGQEDIGQEDMGQESIGQEGMGQEGMQAAPTAEIPQEEPEERMAMSEKKVEVKTETADLKKSNEELQTSLTKAIELIEKMSKPQPKRKSFSTEIEYIKKSETDVPAVEKKEELQFDGMAKSELVQRCNEVSRSGTLEKSDRAIINSFVLRGEGQSQVVEILRRNK